MLYGSVWTDDYPSHLVRNTLVLLGWIRKSTTKTGLSVTANHNEKQYQTGLKVPNAEFKAIQLTRHPVSSQWI